MQSNQKTVDTLVLDVGFMCLNMLMQCSSVVLKLTLSHPHLMHINLAVEQLLYTCTSFCLCEINPEAFLQEFTDVL